MENNPTQEQTLFINGTWVPANGPQIQSVNPSNGNIIWQGNSAESTDVNNAIQAAKDAQNSWESLDTLKRQEYLYEFAKIIQNQKDTLAQYISEEIGKPKWEALTEVQGVISKIAISIEAFNLRCKEFIAGNSVTRFKPHGVVGVFGSFNFPMHIANGHIIPALLAGNTIIFKPSELTPKCAHMYMKAWEQAGLPKGVINLLQGGRDIGEVIVNHRDLNGLYFTGSVNAGISINKSLSSKPQTITALELGGNNPLIVHEISDTKAAVYHTIQSAFITSGQRCTCARRLIIPHGAQGDAFLDLLTNAVKKIKIGDPNDPDVFMGPVITEAAAKEFVNIQNNWVNQGAEILVELKHLKEGTAFVSPGIIDVTNLKNKEDKEVFGPLLQVIRVEDFNQAIHEANNTAFGLSAGLLSDNVELYEQFRREINAGLINWNQQTTGASSSAPFGGIGLSGNHRPTGFFAADYCSYPVASIENTELSIPETLSPGIAL